MNLNTLDIDKWARINATFSDPNRIELMLLLYPRYRKSFIEMKKQLKLSSGTLDYHLKLLNKYHFVDNVLERRSRTMSQYKLTSYGRKVIEAMRKSLYQTSK